MASTVYETDNCCADHLGIEVARLSGLSLSHESPLFLIEVKTCFYICIKTLLLTTHFQFNFMEHLGIFDLI